jgi:hypothetical protein
VPPTLSIGAFVLGGVLLLISVLGGNFELFGAKVPGSVRGIGRFVSFVAGVTLIITGLVRGDSKEADRGGENRTASNSSVQPAGAAASVERPAQPQTASIAAREAEPPSRQPTRDPTPTVHVQWRAATQELIQIVASLTDAEKMMLGYSAIMTGQDIYAIHVRVTNIGTVPVEVTPERFQLTYNGQLVPLNRADDSRFFRGTRLEPNRYTEGLLTYNAPVMIGGLVITGGRLAYQDGGVQVVYSR